MTITLYIIAALIAAILIVWIRKPKPEREIDYNPSECDSRKTRMWLNGQIEDF